MMTRHSNELGSISARRRKKTAMRRPLLVGALAAGVIALGTSTAMAAGPIASPSPGPSTMGVQGMTMTGHKGTPMMSAESMTMPGHKGTAMMSAKCAAKMSAKSMTMTGHKGTPNNITGGPSVG